MGVKKYLIQDYNYSSQALGEKKWGLAEYSLAYYRHNGYLTWGDFFFPAAYSRVTRTDRMLALCCHSLLRWRRKRRQRVFVSVQSSLTEPDFYIAWFHLSSPLPPTPVVLRKCWRTPWMVDQLQFLWSPH